MSVNQCLLGLLALCAIFSLSESMVFVWQLEKLPGRVDAKLVQQYYKFGSHVLDGRLVDEKLLDSGRELAKQLNALGENGENLKATIMLMRVHEWNSKALIEAKLLVEAAVEAYKFKYLCTSNKKYCFPDGATKVCDQVDEQLKKCGPWELLGLQDKKKLSGSKVKVEARLARKKLILMLHPDKNMHLDEKSRDRLNELYLEVEKSFKIVA